MDHNLRLGISGRNAIDHLPDFQGLERVRLAFQQFLDTVEFPVREAERSMERLFRDGGQGSSVDAWSAGRSRCPISRRSRLDR